MQLRPAIEADLPAIVAIYNSIVPGRMVTADLEPVTVESRRAWFASHQNPARPLWVVTEATAPGQICGWASFDTFYPRAAYDGTVMIALYLAENVRGRGLGRWLLGRMIERAPAMGIHSLTGYIFGHNEPSLRLFRSAGFSEWAHLPRVARLDGIDRDLIVLGLRVAP
ncbi:MAG: putative phosphinothricin n-acetyltransferase [Verrucomicrobia bacterium]|nr:putative phosphinothricin n-acetyltransferase [Verrucomicrobiota bacterium]